MTMNDAIVPPYDLEPRQVRAARALLAWSQQDLAKAAGVATSTLADFERGQRKPIANNALAIREALERAGIHFPATGVTMGPPIPLMVDARNTSVPVRWVSAEDLSAWANRIDGVARMPTLISHLIRATHVPLVRLRFPSDEGTRHAGWDGLTSTDVGSAYVPQGEAGWEIGAQRSKIEQKANEDYQKRTKQPASLTPADATYVFVTPRHWPKKDEWAKQRQEEGPWRAVRVYDANDLVHWLEQAPAVGLWLARCLGKFPDGVRELDEVWREWSLATQGPLTEELVLSDRDEDAAAVLRWLRGSPAVLSLQATTADEVCAFFHAVISELPGYQADVYRARCLVTTTADAARALMHAPAPLVLLLMDPDPGLAGALVESGHYVLQAYDEQAMGHGNVRVLARPTRQGIAAALVAAGLMESKAQALARDSARNLTVLRRLMPSAPGRLPSWAKDHVSRALLGALLMGSWDESVEADRVQLSSMVGHPYEAAIAALTPYVGTFDSPLQKVGPRWRIASPFDAWTLLAPHLTEAELGRFEVMADRVLKAPDPRFDMKPDERWLAPLRGVNDEYSDLLRRGIGQVLILLAQWGETVRLVPNANHRSDAIVAKLFRGADARRWWSLSRNFPLLAEASPDEFLSAIEDNLSRDASPLHILFGDDGAGVVDAGAHLMSALGSLAWSPRWMPRVCHVLARLDALDARPRRHANGPAAASLRGIHRLGMPQTWATLDERLRVLDGLRKRQAPSAWALMLGILPAGREIATLSPLPRWRDFTDDKEAETVTWELVHRGAEEVSRRLLEDVGLHPIRWTQLLSRWKDLVLDTQHVLDVFETIEPQVTNEADRVAFWHALRDVLHRHRQFPDAGWTLPEVALDRMEVIYERFAPDDSIAAVAWLFQPSVGLPKPSSSGWNTAERDVDLARERAARDVYAQGGLPAIFSLARQVDTPVHIGRALHAVGLSTSETDGLIDAALQDENDCVRDMARGLMERLTREHGRPWMEALIARATAGEWGEASLQTILRTLPLNRWTWDHVAALGDSVETTYWQSVPPFWMGDNAQDVAYAIRSLMRVGRARDALSLTGRADTLSLPSDLLVELLHQAARTSSDQESASDATMFQHYVAEVFQFLDARDDVDPKVMVLLEWKYLQVLDHSRRPATLLLNALSDDPALFVVMVKAIYMPSEESGIVEPESAYPEQVVITIATQAHRLLERWSRIPGTRPDGTIDGDALESWIRRARLLSAEVGRQAAADGRIGKMLSASPLGIDGHWPAEPVREVIDLFHSESMLEGFWVGKSNRRGVTTRMPGDGGQRERKEAHIFQTWASAIAPYHPYTSKALVILADSYDQSARQQDELDERMDWGA